MEVITHNSKGDDFTSISLMESGGSAFARGYFYSDDDTTFYLDQLSVDPEERKKGIGTKLQEIREDIAKERGFTYTMLWVVKNTWMRDWYKRRGYKYYKPYKAENAVWLRKKIN